MRVFKTLLQQPWLHFLMAGLLLFIVAPQQFNNKVVTISNANLSSYIERNLERLVAKAKRTTDFSEQRGRLKQRYIIEEILAMEAINQGFDKDRYVKMRLITLADYLGLTDMSVEEKVTKMTKLGLIETDPSIRSYLIKRMETQLSLGEPHINEPLINSYYEQYKHKFLNPARFEFEHIFASSDKPASQKRAGSKQRIENMLQKYRQGEPWQQIAEQGDFFYGGHSFPKASERDLARLFGKIFAAQVLGIISGQPEETYHQIQSPYGWHLIRWKNYFSSTPKPITQVRKRIIGDLKYQQQKQRLAQALKRLRQQYQVVIH